jgi:hypothetical protein
MATSNVSKKFSYRDTALEFDTTTKVMLASGFRGIGIAGTNLHDAVSTIGACNARSHHLMSEGFKMLAGVEALDTDSDEIVDESCFDNRSAHEILEDQEAEHDEAEYGEYFDRIATNALRARPDNSPDVIQAYRPDGPSGIDRQAYGYKPGQVIYIRGGLFGSRRRDDRRVMAPSAPSAPKAKPAPTDDHGKRSELRTKLVRAGMGESKATDIASKAKFDQPKVGSLGAKIAAELAASGAAKALDVKPEPAPHRRRLIAATRSAK